MDSLYLLIPVALIFCVIVIRLLLWAIDNGQYEDLDKEAWRILADERQTEQDKQREREQNPTQDQHDH
ncbi:cbb3-type cytochrome oxidase assembly protein CcoS [Kineobactrum salinum]|uniref:Cbb3-type cytochrome oxidase assembly protein CcoS n=1 Tax=Kineobactrum salinum TaxID=2708301 RepID=A0A6C0TY93_9GAMM|nr:cbb3-type cytochrome oxidase assembly protein CcoS [Kineobactrum salinum]QIB64503.1 cbb3-type cytochrome oxidase assembly protein CcoS [Kineobactrum salinum]